MAGRVRPFDCLPCGSMTFSVVTQDMGLSSAALQSTLKGKPPLMACCPQPGQPPLFNHTPSNFDLTHLWRHVVQRAHPRHGALHCGINGQPKVCQPDLIVPRQQHVLRLDVAVHDALQGFEHQWVHDLRSCIISGFHVACTKPCRQQQQQDGGGQSSICCRKGLDEAWQPARRLVCSRSALGGSGLALHCTPRQMMLTAMPCRRQQNACKVRLQPWGRAEIPGSTKSPA